MHVLRHERRGPSWCPPVVMSLPTLRRLRAPALVLAAAPERAIAELVVPMGLCARDAPALRLRPAGYRRALVALGRQCGVDVAAAHPTGSSAGARHFSRRAHGWVGPKSSLAQGLVYPAESAVEDVADGEMFRSRTCDDFSVGVAQLVGGDGAWSVADQISVNLKCRLCDTSDEAQRFASAFVAMRAHHRQQPSQPNVQHDLKELAIPRIGEARGSGAAQHRLRAHVLRRRADTQAETLRVKIASALAQRRVLTLGMCGEYTTRMHGSVCDNTFEHCLA